ncbi:MAG TPA: hypothetical protein DEP88_06060 [Verrucomicrobiales bacterium]|nr:hypothetical protein [Verrucomicrobiales bacterium]HCI91583.1 hypothetical protein [Verrucomicrobiales bacterium]
MAALLINLASCASCLTQLAGFWEQPLNPFTEHRFRILFPNPDNIVRIGGFTKKTKKKKRDA